MSSNLHQKHQLKVRVTLPFDDSATGYYIPNYTLQKLSLGGNGYIVMMPHWITRQEANGPRSLSNIYIVNAASKETK